MTIGGVQPAGLRRLRPEQTARPGELNDPTAACTGSTRTATTAPRALTVDCEIVAEPERHRPADQRPRLRHLRRRQDPERHGRHGRRLRRDQHRRRQLRPDRRPRHHGARHPGDHARTSAWRSGRTARPAASTSSAPSRTTRTASRRPPRAPTARRACARRTRPSTDADPNCDDLPGLALDTWRLRSTRSSSTSTPRSSRCQLAGVLNIVDFVQALGVFYLEADDQGLKLLADAQLLVGPDKIAEPDRRATSRATTAPASPRSSRSARSAC